MMKKKPFYISFTSVKQTLAAISFVSIVLTPFSLFSSPPLLTCFVAMDTPTLKAYWPACGGERQVRSDSARVWAGGWTERDKRSVGQ